MHPDTPIRWKRYPLLLAAGVMALGIGVAASLPAVPWWAWLAPAAGAPAAAALLGLRYRRRLVTPLGLVRAASVAVVVFATGAVRLAAERDLPPHHVGRFVSDVPRTVVLEGRVTAPPESLSYGLRLHFDARFLWTDTTARAATGAVQATLPPGTPALRRGDVLRLRGSLRRPPERRNPADFDVRRYLALRGIHAVLSVRDTAGVARVGHTRSAAERLIDGGRAYVRATLARAVPSAPARRVLATLLLGDRTGLDADVRRQFVHTGLMHLLAVSGLHVLLVGMILYGLLRPVLLRLRLSWRATEVTRAVATLAVLLAYLALTGARASTVRAVVMAALFIGQAPLQRTAPPLNTLGAAALGLLAARPSYLFDVGFQLSFSAVGALLTLAPRFTPRLPADAPPWLRRLGQGTAATVAATLGTTPVLLYHFGQVALGGLVLNLVAIPLTGLTLASALLMLLSGGLPGLAGVFGAAADLFARLLLGLAAAGDAALGWARLTARVQSPLVLLALTAVLLMLAHWPHPRRRWRLAATALALGVVALGRGLATGAFRPHLDVLFFDVGQGDAALVSFPGGRHLLLDAGPRSAFVDAGRRTLLPHLDAAGIRRLDAVLITHPHGDHLGGLPSVLRAVPVGRVLWSGGGYPSALYAETRRLLDSLGVPERHVLAGDTLRMDPAVRLQVLSPGAPPALPDEANDASVVLRLVYGHTTMLFLGDAEAPAEAGMVRRYAPLLASDVVKVGHHGSGTSSSEAFVARVMAAGHGLAVMSLARDNVFGFPDTAVVRRWQAHGATVVTTADAGAVWLRSDGTRIRRVPWR